MEPTSAIILPYRDPLQVSLRVLKALAHPLRMELLKAMSEGGMNRVGLAERVGIKQSVLSHHLRLLKEAQIISRHRSGKNIEYRLDSNRLMAIINAVQELNGKPASWY